jgi:Na+-driven multidrug efflux pump
MPTRRTTAPNSADRRRMLTEGPILEALVKLSLPIVLANTLQALYQLVDTFWVGRMGDVAVAAVSVSLPIWFTLTAAAGGLAVVGTTFVAQYAGARNPEMVTHTVGQIHILVVVASVVVAAGGYVAADPILHLMGVEAELFGPAGDYMRITFIGVVFQFLYFVFQSVLRGIGEVRFPL